jgi:hypothetical protein
MQIRIPLTIFDAGPDLDRTLNLTHGGKSKKFILLFTSVQVFNNLGGKLKFSEKKY